MTTETTELREWRRYGFGGPPEPWDHGDRQDLDRLATSYYVDILEDRARILSGEPQPDLWQRVEELFATATRHKQEIDYALRHWATPAEQEHAAELLGELMRISRQFHVLANGPHATDGPDSDAA